MAFIDFDDISKTLADKGKEAAQKAKDVAEIVQLKAQATSEKNKVKSLYAAIGQLYYKNHKNDTDGEYQSIVDEITKSLAAVAELQDKVRKLDGSVICPSCGAVIKKGNKFCGKCGTAAPEPVREESAEEESAEEESAEEENAEEESVEEESTEEESAEEESVEEAVDAEFAGSAEEIVEETAESLEKETETAAEAVEEAVEKAVEAAAEVAEEAADEVKSGAYGE